ncbi:formate dehydrogenase subunit gamma [Texcoconibacillus texcoconensis]|uniref:Formate dehydrogenase gamma subunit n=1 Tax=Texcoconibacillus texcoconensis TaxID=1095777 RepID=A0A840QPT0_9BACI|nr:cytochrome b/b6 domain-containing protein [Texcoconibacillus texcoconensis]MBB5173327.1 formate dehydrogenase gamma subunit [Texcoconibacillus texcoconensis]
MSNKTKANRILRHPVSNRVVHWLTAFSIVMLIITGLGQLPLYGRYLLVQPPGTQWLTNYEATLLVHYIFAILLLFIVTYHLIYHLIRKEFDILPRKGDVKGSIAILKAMILRKKEPPSDKYLPEQRLTYAYFFVAIGLAVVTGVIKVIKNVIGVQASDGVLLWAAQLHNLATVLIIVGVIMHLGAFIVKENRKLLSGMFTGYVDKHYVKERHTHWYKRIKHKDKKFDV